MATTCAAKPGCLELQAGLKAGHPAMGDPDTNFFGDGITIASEGLCVATVRAEGASSSAPL